MNYNLFRLAWRIGTWGTSFRKIVPIPSNFRVYHSFSALEESGLIYSLLLAYQTVFSNSSAWQEDYSFDEIRAKLRRQLTGMAAISLMLNYGGSVTGFCWGQVISVKEIVNECKSSISFAAFDTPIWEELQKTLSTHFSQSKILFIHELGILKDYRGGGAPIQFLIRPVLEVGRQNECKDLLWWTNPKSNAYALSKIAGLTPLFKANNIVFMHTSQYYPLLSVLTHYDAKQIELFLEKVTMKKRGVNT